jgi:hypothetical protein
VLDFLPLRQPAWSPTRERIVLAVLLVLFLAVNLLTAERSPTVWQDEVLYADPAINVIRGHGFTSAAWFAQPKEEMWVGNAPLHTLLLIPWLSMWGVTPTSVRSVNYLYIVVAAALMWAWARRLRIIKSASMRLVFVTLLICGQGVAFGYRSGRNDSIGILLVAGALFATAFQSSRLRTGLLAVIGLLLPFAGLQLIPFVMLLCVLLGFFLGAARLRPTIAFGLGCAFGATLLVLGPLFLGLWGGFCRSVLALAGPGLPQQGRFLSYLLGKAASGWWALEHDLSALCVIVCLGLAVAVGLSAHDLNFRSPGVVGLTIALALPPVMSLAGRFPAYYSWMVFVPGTVCGVMVLERWLGTPPVGGLTACRVLLASFGGLLGLAVVVGLPLRLTRAVAEWSARDYAQVESLVRTHVGAGDWVYCTYSAYYPAKDVAEVVFLPPYRRVMRRDEKARITTLVVAPNEAAEAQALIGGEWREVGVSLAGRKLTPAFEELQSKLFGQAAYRYNLTMLRRVVERAKMR